MEPQLLQLTTPIDDIPTILLTRSRDEADDFITTLAPYPISVICASFISLSARPINPTDLSLVLAQNPVIFFSSANGIRYLWPQLNDTDQKSLAVATILTVGPKTAQAVLDYLPQASVWISPTHNATEAIQTALTQKRIAPGQTLLWPTGERAEAPWLPALQTQNVHVHRFNVYQTTPHQQIAPNVTLNRKLTAIAVTSPSSVVGLKACGLLTTSLPCFSIGPSTTSALQQDGIDSQWIVEAKTATLTGLAEAIINTLPS